MADQVLYSGVACITDLMVKEGLINLDFADVRAVMREMGKAMMGTGEASGEKRALTAAEAAISNPLIDDNSMKGARGLLISITGGRDLTLYEVDEAATRIREEVDQDANIIVGATFDESLEGIIRVSVVATGIDKVALAEPAPAPAITTQAVSRTMESRLSELTQQLRANSHRLAERMQRNESPGEAPAAHAPAPIAPPAESHVAVAEVAEATQPAAPEATAIQDVTIRPIAPKPSLFIEPVAERAQPQEAPAEKTAFIPPQAERPAARAPRMPRIEDLPIPAQNEIRARRAAEAGQADKPRPSLLQRLASVGLGRREDPAPQPQAPRPANHRPTGAERLPPYPAPRLQEPRGPEQRPQEPVSEYAKRAPAPRPAPQGLDPHGRPVPVAPSIDDDQLEIPAFLRRQAN
jgi:cell division protein FtsZ